MSAPPVQMDALATVEDKIESAQERKALGDKAFRDSDWPSALRCYHEALMFLSGLDKKGLPSVATQPSTEADSKAITKVDVMMETVHLNMAACHLKTNNFKRALVYAEKAVAHNPENTKGQFRKAKALAGLGYTEKSITILQDLVSKHPEDATFKTELTIVTQKQKEAEAKSYAKFKGFLGKKSDSAKEEASTSS